MQVYRPCCILPWNATRDRQVPNLLKVYIKVCPLLGFSRYSSDSLNSSIPKQEQAKHILQCRRKSLNAPPYQQRYSNEKRAHRRVQRTFLQFCYLCAEFYHTEASWQAHCQSHLDNLQPRCGILTFRYTLVSPGLCPICLGDCSKKPDERFNQWVKKATLVNHIDTHLASMTSSVLVCPHPCCQSKQYSDIYHLRHHFYDAHSIEEPRSNCVSRKRKHQSNPDSAADGNDTTKPRQRKRQGELDLAEKSVTFLHQSGDHLDSSMVEEWPPITSAEDLMAEFDEFERGELKSQANK